MAKSIFNPVTDFFNESKFIWMKLKEETPIFYLIFESYRDLFLDRSVKKAVKSNLTIIAQSEAEWTKNKNETQLLVYLDDVASKHHWRMRAEAYDSWLSEKRRRQRETDYFRDQDKLLNGLHKIFKKLVDKVTESDFEELTVINSVANIPNYAKTIQALYDGQFRGEQDMPKDDAPPTVDGSNLIDWDAAEVADEVAEESAE